MTLTPGLRKVGLVAHVITSVGWLGSVVAFLAVGVAVIGSDDPELLIAGFLAMDWMVLYSIVPLSLASLLIAVVQSLGSPWGLFRHWWVVVKLAMTVAAVGILLQYTQTMGYIVDAATPAMSAADLRGLAASPLLHASGGLAVLIVATVLSVYKPRGLTPYGWRQEEVMRRKQRQRRTGVVGG